MWMCCVEECAHPFVDASLRLQAAEQPVVWCQEAKWEWRDLNRGRRSVVESWVFSCARTWRRAWSQPRTRWSGGSSAGQTMTRSESAACRQKPASAPGPPWTTRPATCRSDQPTPAEPGRNYPWCYIFIENHQMAGMTKWSQYASYLRLIKNVYAIMDYIIINKTRRE